MLSIGAFVLALALIALVHWTYRWRNPKSNGKLPPGSMGLPLIGETIQFFIPSKSIDMPYFVKKRIKKYGLVFKTSLAGRPVVISADAEASHYILQQEGKLVELWYMDSLAKLVGHNESLKPAMSPGQVHKFVRKTVAEHLGYDALQGKLLPELEELAKAHLDAWTREKSVELRHATARAIMYFTSKLMFGYDLKKFGEDISVTYSEFMKGLMAVPLNIPGTAFHKCLKNRKAIVKMIMDTIKERKTHPESRRGDFLDSLMDEMKAQNSMTDDFICLVIFVILFATSETLPVALTVAIKFLTEYPLVLQELVKEHDDILRRREKNQTGLTWKEYKSMTFTMNVINETIRMSGSTGMLRRVIGDINVNGYTIPKGWTIAIIPSVHHMNPDAYEDPLTFNPWRWQAMGPSPSSKNFIAFGAGMRACGGADYSKVLMAVFLHTLVTNYRWTKVKGGEVARAPMLVFGDGYYIKVENRQK